MSNSGTGNWFVRRRTGHDVTNKATTPTTDDISAQHDESEIRVTYKPSDDFNLDDHRVFVNAGDVDDNDRG
jgi:hypothetical protein